MQRLGRLQQSIRYLSVIGTCLVATIPAEAGVWQKGTQLDDFSRSTIVSTTATNAAGLLAAAWIAVAGSGSTVHLILKYRARDNLGHWGPTEIIPSSSSPDQVQLALSPNGVPTLAWTDYDGSSVIKATSKIGGVWQTAKTVYTGKNDVQYPALVANDNGDLALAWEDGHRKPNTVLLAVKRASATDFAPVLTVADSVAHTLRLGKVAINGQGDAVVAWQSIDLVGRKDQFTNVALHVSRLPSGASTLERSPALDGIFDGDHRPYLAIDNQGRAAVSSFSTVLRILAQAGRGQPWTRTQLAYGYQPLGLGVDAAGKATLLVDVAQSADRLAAVTGNFATNLWGSPVYITGDQGRQVYVCFKLAPSGTAVVTWYDSTLGGLASARPSTGTAWSNLTSLHVPYFDLSPDDCTASSSGKAGVTYSGYSLTTPPQNVLFEKVYK